MQYTESELKEILAKHWKWVKNEKDGVRANLRSADLSSANLRSADLRSADLRSANLRSADLSETPYEKMNWLSYLGIIPAKNGQARAYKMVTKKGSGPQYSGIDYLKTKIVTCDSFDADIKTQCGHGVNLATFQWCLHNKSEPTYRLLLMEFDCSSDNVCCPIATDGKFRVKTATRIGECDWSGNLLIKKEATN
jgi:hypothetical protein